MFLKFLVHSWNSISVTLSCCDNSIEQIFSKKLDTANILPKEKSMLGSDFLLYRWRATGIKYSKVKKTQCWVLTWINPLPLSTDCSQSWIEIGHLQLKGLLHIWCDRCMRFPPGGIIWILTLLCTYPLGIQSIKTIYVGSTFLPSPDPKCFS